MLTYKQLQDAAECNGKICYECAYFSDKDRCAAAFSIGDAIGTTLALADMLKRLEWSQEEWSIICPICRNGQTNGHKLDCELAALLKGLEGLE